MEDVSYYIEKVKKEPSYYDEMRVANIELREKQKFFAEANVRRGALLEFLAKVIMRIHYGIDDFETRVSFSTPFGVRFVDLYSPSKKLSIEVKSGRVGSRKFTRKQLEKDNYILMNSDEVLQSIWFCFRGATPSLQKIISKTDIQYVSFAEVELDPENDMIKKMIKIDVSEKDISNA
jgi:hypothetical protein